MGHLKELMREKILLELYEKAFQLRDSELYDYALEQAVLLTSSTIGFFHLVSDDQKTIILTTWNSEALKNCTAAFASHYPIDQAGIWVDCVRFKKPVVCNDYQTAPNRKGIPEGHTPIQRFISIPVMEEGKARIIFGVGNRAENYDEQDVLQVQLVANELYKIIRQRRANEALRASEERFRLILDFTYDWEFWKDEDGTILYCSPSCQRITGYSAADFINDPALLLKIVHPDDRHLMEKHRDRVNNTREVDSLEYRVITRTGELRWIGHVCRPVSISGGKPYGRRASNRDITENKQMEEQLTHSREMKLLGQMAAGVAHEVRNPLNAILAITEALFKDIGPNSAYQPYLEHIRSQVTRLSNLMKDLLELGKPIHSESFDVEVFREILSNIHNLWQETKFAKTHKLSLIVPSEVEKILIKTDSLKLRQIILNLLENAAQNSPNGSAIEFRVEALNRGSCIIKIGDQGTGIPEECLNRVFDPFFTTRAGGTGLGLSLVKNFVESMGGKVAIWNNDPPPGCTVKVTLPIVSG